MQNDKYNYVSYFVRMIESDPFEDASKGMQDKNMYGEMKFYTQLASSSISSQTIDALNEEGKTSKCRDLLPPCIHCHKKQQLACGST